jgi:hypothetical protein
MSDDLVKQSIAELQDIVRCRCHPAYKELVMQDPDCECDSADAVQVVADRIEELEAKLERISEEWAGAVYGDLENGVASLNAAAATDFYKRYPSISSFGDTLRDILLEGEGRG